MKKTTITYIFIVIAISTVSVLILHLLARYQATRPNAFLRKYIVHSINPLGVRDLSYNSFDILGVTDEKLLLTNRTANTLLLKLNYDLTTVDVDTLNFVSEDFLPKGMNAGSFKNNIFFSNGAIPVIYTGDLKNLEVNKIELNNTFKFLDFMPISISTAIIRSYNETEKQNILEKIDLVKNVKSRHGNSLEKQIDGVFCTDGMLIKNDSLNELIYVYYYRNEFLRFNSDLKLISRGLTIDTIQFAQIRVSELDNKKRSKMSVPPVIVNESCNMSEKYIFIKSPRLAKNDNRKIFDTVSIIDVYSLSDNSYQFSFQISNYKGKRMRSFFVHNEMLFAMFGEYVLSFKLNYNSY